MSPNNRISYYQYFSLRIGPSAVSADTASSRHLTYMVNDNRTQAQNFSIRSQSTGTKQNIAKTTTATTNHSRPDKRTQLELKGSRSVAVPATAKPVHIEVHLKSQFIPSTTSELQVNKRFLTHGSKYSQI